MYKVKVLFLCSGNSCRSQIAEGWARTLASEFIEPYSAGLAPKGIDMRAVRVMAEAGVDISFQNSKHVNELADINFDYVVTVCSDADKQCPVFTGGTSIIHRGFDDPPLITDGEQNEEKALAIYRRVRDEIRDFIITIEGVLNCERRAIT